MSQQSGGCGCSCLSLAVVLLLALLVFVVCCGGCGPVVLVAL